MENINSKLILVSNSLSVIENQLIIGNKILLNDNKKNQILDFLINFTLEMFKLHEYNYFNAFIFISNKYPLSYEMIVKYERCLKFNYLSMNTNINWFEGLIDLFIDKWDWKKLSSNKSLPWSIDLIEKYENYWDWKELCSNEKLPWNKDFIEKYMDILLDDKIAESIGGNKEIQWTDELISLFEKEGEYFKALIFMSDKICGGKRNNHLKINYDKSVFEDVAILDICWSCLSRSIEYVDDRFFSIYDKKICWFSFSENVNCLTEEIIEKYRDKLSWSILSCNEKLPWSIGFIKKYEKYWNWKYLSGNEGVIWSVELIDEFIDKWDWSYALLINSKIPISIDFIIKYDNYIDLSLVFGQNSSNFWTDEFIDYFEFHSESWWFSHNNNFPWSIEMIRRFKKYNCSSHIHNCVVDEILPFLDDESVIHIFDKILEK